MMRIGLIVAGLGTLTLMELGTPSRTKTIASDSFEQLTLDVSVLGDTLETADRHEIHHLLHEATVKPISAVEPTPPLDVTTIIPENDSSTVGHGTNDKKDVVRKLRPKPKYTASNKPRSKHTNSNKAPKTERPKAMAEQPCRPSAFDELLQALNLSFRCQT